MDHFSKSMPEFSDLLAKGNINWCSHRVYILNHNNCDILFDIIYLAKKHLTFFVF